MTTDTLPAPVMAGAPFQKLKDAFGRLGQQQRVAFGGSAALLVSLVIGATLWGRQPDYKVLFTGVSEKDGGAIIATLEQQNIPHKFSENGTIMVPASRVHELRLKLAAQGLPRGALAGFELLENQKFGTSQFAEQVNYQRGLEGELARTIQSISTVQTARVHLAIPKPSVFVREAQKPTASVLLTLYPGRTLEAGQIAGITHLISSSIPQMPAENVSIIDQQGALLSQLKSSADQVGLDPAQIKYVRTIEQGVAARVSDILRPIVGDTNFRVQIAAAIDFSNSEETSERFQPNGSPDKAALRSEMVNENASSGSGNGGVPGALSNQPPVPATSPLTVPAVGGTGQGAAQPGAGSVKVAGVDAPLKGSMEQVNATRNVTRNYEVDHSVRHTKEAPGAVRRLSAAVVINVKKDAKGKGEPDMKQLQELIRQAMGFDGARGDSVSVVSTTFAEVQPTDDTLPVWKDPEIRGYAKDLSFYVVLLAGLYLIYRLVLSPALKTMFPTPESKAANATPVGKPGEPTEVSETEEHAAPQDRLAELIATATQDPQAVALVVKQWMNIDAA